MSIVAQQYNILSESLRRGIAGFQAGEESQAQMGLEKAKLEYGIEMGQKREERESALFEHQQKMFPAQEKAATTQAALADVQLKTAQQKAEESDWQHELDIKQRTTPVTGKTLQSLSGSPLGPDNDFLYNSVIVPTAKNLEWNVPDDPNKPVTDKRGRPVSIWELKRTDEFAMQMAQVNPADALDAKMASLQQVQTEAVRHDDQETVGQVQQQMGKAMETKQWIQSHPYEYAKKRLDNLVNVSMNLENPEKMKMAVGAAMEELKQAAARTNIKSSDLGQMHLFATTSDGKVLEQVVAFNKADGFTAEDAARYAKSGWFSEKDLPTMDKMTATAVRKYANNEKLDGGEQMLLSRISAHVGSEGFMEMAAQGLGADLVKMQGTPAFNKWYMSGLTAQMRQNGDWKAPEQLNWYIHNLSPDLTDEQLVQEVRYAYDVAKKRGWPKPE